MRHVLVSYGDDARVDELRDAADPSTTFLPEPDMESALERLARSARIDAVITDDPELVAAIRELIPGSIPVYLAPPGEEAHATLDALDRLMGEEGEAES